jgi:hypothetical protein
MQWCFRNFFGSQVEKNLFYDILAADVILWTTERSREEPVVVETGEEKEKKVKLHCEQLK